MATALPVNERRCSVSSNRHCTRGERREARGERREGHRWSSRYAQAGFVSSGRGLMVFE